MRKQVKQELESRLPPRATENPSSKAEQKQEDLTASPAIEPVEGKREEKRFAQPSDKAAPSRVERRASTAPETETEVKAVPTPPAPNAPKVEQKKTEPVAPNCGPKPALVSSRQVKEHQLGRLAIMKHELCLKTRFQGLAVERWVELMIRMEDATTSHERTLISQEIDQFARDFIYKDGLEAERQEAARREAARQEAARQEALRQETARREAARQEAERQEAERREAARQEALRLESERLESERLEALRLEAERLESERLKSLRTLLADEALDDANLDTSGCQPVVSAGCELLLQRFRSIQAAFLTTSPSQLAPLRELSKIGQEIRATRTHEELQQAAQALKAWLQRQLAQ
ncbi:MAG TPA: hypothetical protein VFZ09_07830 [Archangium sp.]|uniref:hypothetical protein n=1 Tax=Archangium sp. TaxID=1872627 RepID=UPI002E34E40C|nr:hypothetical protein [Archangium sp.]HEX5746137.1 hypothetical protein [Archangium sp.]